MNDNNDNTVLPVYLRVISIQGDLHPYLQQSIVLSVNNDTLIVVEVPNDPKYWYQPNCLTLEGLHYVVTSVREQFNDTVETEIVNNDKDEWL